MRRELHTWLAGAVLMASACAAFAQSSDATPGGGTGMISILDVAPATYWGILRYPKFYGDPNMDHATVDGSLADRQYLLGSLGGVRDVWAKNGVIVDVGVTQAMQGVASGPGSGATYYGSADLWVGLDTGRAGLWSGGLVFAHLEGNWGHTVDGSGAVMPLNSDTIMPAAPSEVALSELYIFQALPKNFAVLLGKIDFSAYADLSLFANNERDQFMYEGLVNDPILGAFIPYTTLGFGLFKQLSSELGMGIVVASNDNNALSPGFDELSSDTMTYGYAVAWTPKLGGDRPGNYGLLVGYTSKAADSFAIDERYFIGEITGQLPIAKKPDNYAVALAASQYLWVDKNAKRSDGKPVGGGPFLRLGFSPRDRNVIDQFYSLGIGGWGGPFGRVNDNWGVGWAQTHFSSELRGLISGLGVPVRAAENAVEAFYNIALTPAVGLTLDLQNIHSANPARGDAFVIAWRLQLDL